MKKIFIPIVITSCVCFSACTISRSRYSTYQYHKHIENQNLFVTEILHREFDVIKRTLQILERASNNLDDGKPVSKETFSEIVDIILGFSDKHHQEKEDKVLFPLLKDKNEGEKKDFLGRLLMEHVSERDMIRNLAGAISNFHQGKKAQKKITKIAYTYIKHMEKHIQTEEKILFPWVNMVLTRDEQVMLIKKFEEMEKEDIEAGVHEKYTAMIERLEEQLGIYIE